MKLCLYLSLKKLELSYYKIQNGENSKHKIRIPYNLLLQHQSFFSKDTKQTEGFCIFTVTLKVKNWDELAQQRINLSKFHKTY